MQVQICVFNKKYYETFSAAVFCGAVGLSFVSLDFVSVFVSEVDSLATEASDDLETAGRESVI
jgi:hypothetical protein